jgi:hypothetical protein
MRVVSGLIKTTETHTEVSGENELLCNSASLYHLLILLKHSFDVVGNLFSLKTIFST